MSPVGKKAAVPVVGDDENELEIVQFGAQLTAEQIDRGEKLALVLAKARGAFATAETAGPSEIAKTAKDLRRQIAVYNAQRTLVGKIAYVTVPGPKAPVLSAIGELLHGSALAAVVTDKNETVIPLPLVQAEIGMRGVVLGYDSEQEAVQRIHEIENTPFLGETPFIVLLKGGTAVRINALMVNNGFASRVLPLTGDWAAYNMDGREVRLWVNSCFLRLTDTDYQKLLESARSCD